MRCSIKESLLGATLLCALSSMGHAQAPTPPHRRLDKTRAFGGRRMAILPTWRTLSSVLVVTALLAGFATGRVAAAQERAPERLTSERLLGLASRGDVDTADRAVER